PVPEENASLDLLQRSDGPSLYLISPLLKRPQLSLPGKKGRIGKQARLNQIRNRHRDHSAVIFQPGQGLPQPEIGIAFLNLPSLPQKETSQIPSIFRNFSNQSRRSEDLQLLS